MEIKRYATFYVSLPLETAIYGLNGALKVHVHNVQDIPILLLCVLFLLPGAYGQTTGNDDSKNIAQTQQIIKEDDRRWGQ